jgi:hypothetical protein
MDLLHTPLPAALAPLVAVGLFILIWTGVVRLLRRLARLTDTLPAGAGARLARSGWGNGEINGTRAKGCVRIERYAGGLAVRMHPIFGGGLIWLPDSLTEREADNPQRLTLRHGDHRIVLLGRLAEFASAGGAPSALGGAPVSARRAEPPTPLAAPIRREGGSRLATLALWVAVLMLAWVAARRWAPEWSAPLEAWVRSLG